MASQQPSNVPSTEIRSYPGSQHIPFSCCKCICEACKKNISQNFKVALPLSNNYLIDQIYNDKENKDEAQPSQLSQPQTDKSQRNQMQGRDSFDEKELLSSTKSESPQHSINPNRSAKNATTYRSYPSEQLANVSAPNYQSLQTGSSNQTSKNYTNERRENFSAPEYHSFPINSSARNRSYPSERLTNVSAPQYSSFQPSSLANSSHRTEQRNNVRQRTFIVPDVPNISSSAHRTRYRSYPNERIDDISAFNFQNLPSHSSTNRAIRTRDRSYPNEYIADFSAPSYRSLPANSSARMDYRIGNIIYPSENIVDISAPTYESQQPNTSVRSVYRNYPDERIANISNPNYHSLSPTRSYIDGRLVEYSAPYRSMLPVTQNQSLYRVTERNYPYDRVIHNAARRYQGLPPDYEIIANFPSYHRSYNGERIADISAPLYHSLNSLSHAQSLYRTEDRSYPDERIAEISAPAYQSLSQNSPIGIYNSYNYFKERLPDISAPHNQGLSSTRNRSDSNARYVYKSDNPYQSVLPRTPTRRPYRAEYDQERIADISAPSLMSNTRSPYKINDRSFPTENISNITAPPYESIPQSSLRREDVSFPSENVANISAATYHSLSQNDSSNKTYLNKETINNSNPYYQSLPQNISTKSYYRTEKGNDPVTDIPVNSYRNLPPTPEEKSYPSERIADISAPYQSFSVNTPSRRAYREENRSYLDERIGDISAPTFESFPESIDRQSPYRTEDRSYPRERLTDISAPLYQSLSLNSAANNDSRNRDRSYPNERIIDVSIPSYNTFPSNSISMPIIHSKSKSYGDERIDDISAPSYQSFPTSSTMRRTNRTKEKSYPNERIEDISAPVYQSFADSINIRSPHTTKDRSYPKERLADISAPFYQSLSSNSQANKNFRARDRSYPNERIIDVSVPTFYSSPKNSMSLPNNRNKERSYADERIEDTTAPSYKSIPSMNQTNYISYPSKRVQKKSASLYKSLLTKEAHKAGDKSYPSERITEVSAPTFQSLSLDNSFKTKTTDKNADNPERLNNEVQQPDLSADSLYMTTHPPSSTLKSTHITENISLQYYTMPNNTQRIAVSKQISSQTIVSFTYNASDGIPPINDEERAVQEITPKQILNTAMDHNGNVLPVTARSKSPELLAELIIPNNFDRELIIVDNEKNPEHIKQSNSENISSYMSAPGPSSISAPGSSQQLETTGPHVIAKLRIPFEFDRQLPTEENENNSKRTEKANRKKQTPSGLVGKHANGTNGKIGTSDSKKHSRKRQEVLTNPQIEQGPVENFHQERDITKSSNVMQDNEQMQQQQKEQGEPEILFNRQRDMPNNTNVIRKYWSKKQQNGAEMSSRPQPETLDPRNQQKQVEQNSDIVSSPQQENFSSNTRMQPRLDTSDDIDQMRQDEFRENNSETVFDYLHRMIDSIRQDFSLNKTVDEAQAILENMKQRILNESIDRHQIPDQSNLTYENSLLGNQRFHNNHSRAFESLDNNDNETNPHSQLPDAFRNVYEGNTQNPQNIHEINQFEEQSLLSDIQHLRDHESTLGEEKTILFDNQNQIHRFTGNKEENSFYNVDGTLYNIMENISHHDLPERPKNRQYVPEIYSTPNDESYSCCKKSKEIPECFAYRMNKKDNCEFDQKQQEKDDCIFIWNEERNDLVLQENDEITQSCFFSSSTSSIANFNENQCCCNETPQCSASSKLSKRKRKCKYKRKAKKFNRKL